MSRRELPHPSLAWTRYAFWVAAALAVTRLAVTAPNLARGFAGEGPDFRYLRSAGLAWRAGLNPYAAAEINRVTDAPLDCAFAYAPTASPLVMGLSLPPRRAGTETLAALGLVGNLVAVGYLIFAAFGVLPRELARVVAALVVGACLGSLYVAGNLYCSQTTLLSLGLLCGAEWAYRLGRPGLCGVLAAVGTFKPSVGAFYFLLVLGRRDSRATLAFVATALALAAWPAYVSGPVGLVRTWLGAMNEYTRSGQNRPGFAGCFGVPNWLALHGFDYRLAPPLAAAGLAWSAARRRWLAPDEAFALALAWPVLFVQAHNYDVVMLFPLFASALALSASSPARLALAALAVLAVNNETHVFDRFLGFRVDLYPGALLAVSLACLAGVVVAVERRARAAPVLSRARPVVMGRSLDGGAAIFKNGGPRPCSDSRSIA